jgi:hypothetical protein
MSLSAIRPVKAFVFGCLITATAAALLRSWAVGAPAAGPPPGSLQALVDRAQIEELLVDYYGQLGKGGHGFGTYYVADGTLDVNGVSAQGEKPIEALYVKVGEGSIHRPGTFRMLLTNLHIAVNGDHATADVIWTGVNSEAVTAAPQFIEQGREHDELVKQGGHWYFRHRVISSDGGMQPMFLGTYQRK